jgi:uncharacterized protein YjbI with pentapeptide repeats
LLTVVVAKLMESNLELTNFKGANLESANLSNSNVKNANLDAYLKNTICSGTNLWESKLPEDEDLSGVIGYNPQ